MLLSYFLYNTVEWIPSRHMNDLLFLKLSFEPVLFCKLVPVIIECLL
jgi:hypothetical protein